MSEGRPRLERLQASHGLDCFDSGNDDLNTWLRRHAVAAQRMDEAPPKLVRGLPSYPVGMVLLARLAVDRRLQGRGLGALLLSEALRRAVAAGEAVAARLFVVDAVDEDAARFYERYGFVAMPEHALRLYRGIKDIRSSLEEDGGS